MKLNIALLALFALLGCTDAQMTQFTTLGTSGHIRCYSGNYKFYEGDSTGKIATETQSDGWYFREKGSGKLIRISGACLIVN
jgi:hypothetical protein